MAVHIQKNQSSESFMKKQEFDAVQRIRKIVTWWVECEPEGGIEEPTASSVILPEKWKEMVRKLPLQN